INQVVLDFKNDIPSLEAQNYHNHSSDPVTKRKGDQNDKGPGDPCNNADFETGDCTGWDMTEGEVESWITVTDPFSYINVTPATCGGGTAGQHSIMTGTGTDPIGGFPVVNPDGGGTSLMLGDGTGTGNGAAAASQTFLVDANSVAFTYSYAIVLNDAGHDAEEQPYFKVNMYDENGDPIACGDYSVVAGSVSGFENYSGGVFLPWTTTFAPLQGYIGQNVTIEFIVGDCAQGGHYGYGYIDASCAPLEIIRSDTIMP